MQLTRVSLRLVFFKLLVMFAMPNILLDVLALAWARHGSKEETHDVGKGGWREGPNAMKGFEGAAKPAKHQCNREQERYSSREALGWQ